MADLVREMASRAAATPGLVCGPTVMRQTILGEGAIQQRSNSYQLAADSSQQQQHHKAI